MKDNFLFDNFEEYSEQEWRKEWKDMPEYIQKNLMPKYSIIVHFKNKEDREEFSKLINQKITNKTKYLYYPKIEIEKIMNKRYISES